MRHIQERDTETGTRKKCFSLPPENPNLYSSKNIMKSAWGDFINEVGAGKLHIRADLTFQKGMMMNTPAVGGKPSTRFYQSINEDIARHTISTFLDRLNYAAYKHAYKRYGKRLCVVSAIEGGKTSLRQNTYTNDRDKHIHAHLMLELPEHMIFADMYAAITKHWYALEWSNIVSQI